MNTFLQFYLLVLYDLVVLLRALLLIIILIVFTKLIKLKQKYPIKRIPILLGYRQVKLKYAIMIPRQANYLSFA